MAHHTIVSAIPQVPINRADSYPRYEHSDYPKMMLFKGESGQLTPYRNDDDSPIIVRNPEEEEVFRAEHPEAVHSANTNPAVVRAEELESENAALKRMLAEAGVKMPSAPAARTAEADEPESKVRDLNEPDSELPPAMTTKTSTAVPAKKPTRK